MDEAHNARQGRRGTGTVTVLATGAGARLVLTGEVDVGMNAELHAAVAELEMLQMPIEVHTRDVTYVDSSVMAVLARLAYRCEQPIRLVDPPALVRYLVLVAELDDVVEIVTRRVPPDQPDEEIEARTLLRAQDRCSCAACRADPMHEPATGPATS